jgi:predicted nucleic acid-binding protein
VSVLLDTSILIGVEQQRVSRSTLPPRAAVSAITLEELWLGVLLGAPSLKSARQQTFDAAVALYEVLLVDAEVARACAEIRVEGRSRKVRYAPLDSLIGATARVHGLALFTQDEGMVGMLGVDVRMV